MSELLIDSTPDRGKHWSEREFNIVTIDVLRATSTIAVALFCQAEEVIPCAEVEEARSYQGQDDTLLAGERKGEIIPGFDYTNSPHDLSKIDLKNKRVILTTSDGTKLITNASEAQNVLVATTLNYEAIAQAILGIGGNWALIGAGSSGDFRPEDKVGCALVGKSLLSNGNFKISQDDLDFISFYSENWEQHILESLSTQKLRKIGRDVDVNFVIDEANNYPVVPVAKKELNHVSIKTYEKK
jgi:2-phosphosulfolactate phosphatase